MAQFVYGQKNTSTYAGIGEIFEYTNDDGIWCEVNCGQAAGATFLTHYQKIAPEPRAARNIMARLEKQHPPDNLGGFLGTSRRCVMRMCKRRGMPVKSITGENAVRRYLQLGLPVIVMLGVPGGRWWIFDLPGGHWMVAYGFDDECVYLTNWGPMPWDDFRNGWDAWAPRLINMRKTGLVAKNLGGS